MNIHTTDISPEPTRAAAEDALRLLRAWAASANPDEIATLDPAIARLIPGPAQDYPDFSRHYPADFISDDAYRATLPDLQNGPESLIKGARRRIQHVGISNFRMPLLWARRDGAASLLDTSVTGSVSLEAEQKGINMSRILRSFQANADGVMDADRVDVILDAYLVDLGAFDARLQLNASVPLKVQSLRSGLTGWQYYDAALEIVQAGGQRTRIWHLDYVYSSTCPCSLELSEHARATRGQLATPHSQRSVARLSVVCDPDAPTVHVEDIVDLARAAVPTETQVMVKREDEQAFAELNAANPIFVEDAARLFAEGLGADPRLGDYRVVASHQESLHSHDAVSILSEGPTFDGISLDPQYFSTLIHR